MPDIYIIVITAVFFAFCTAAVLYQAIYSVYFRKNIAIPHGFSEGIMTGITYPLLWITYGLIAVQFLSFIIFRNSGELVLSARLLLFALSVLAFAAIKTLTPPLLAYWFGKSAFWDSKGEIGKNLFEDIYCVKVHKKKSSRVINDQQLYKITFYVKGKTFLLIPKKHVCKMTAKQISVLTSYVDFKECKKPKPTKKGLLYSVCLPLLLTLILCCTFMMAVTSGILNPEKYAHSTDALSAPITKEIETVSNITSVITDGSRIYVYYGDIGAINTYSTDGKYLFSVSLPHSVFKSTDIAVSDGELVYKFGDKLIRYTSDGQFISNEDFKSEHKALFDDGTASINGEKLTFDARGVRLGSRNIVKRPAYCTGFNTELLWSVNITLIVLLFVLRQFVLGKKSEE